jgi:putative ABC transport system permease protein
MSWSGQRPPLPLRIAVRLLPEEVREEVLGDLLEKWHREVRDRGVVPRAFWLARQPLVALRLRAWDGGSEKRRRNVHSTAKAGLPVSWIDVKLGLRMLGKQPTLTLVAGFALVLGIPVGLYPAHMTRVWVQSLPVDEGERIRVIRYRDLEGGDFRQPSLEDLERWLEALGSFESLAAATVGASYNIVSPDGQSAPVHGAEVTASVFDILRTAPLLGRTLIAADEIAGAPAVAVIGYDLWRSRFASDAEVVGRPVQVGGVAHTIVGVMPEGFRYPYRDDLWLPLRMGGFVDAPGGWEGAHHLVFGRLVDGVAPDQAELELVTLHQALAAEAPASHARLQPEVAPFAAGIFDAPADGFVSDPEFYAMQLLFVLVLVVACTNVGMLTLARTAMRSSELAVRTALGAGRGRIVSQLFVESLVLAVLAAGLGLLLGDQVVLPWMGWLLDQGPAWLDFGVQPETVVWAISLSVLSAAVVGMVPALKATGKSVHRNIQRASAGRSGIRFGGLSSALLVTDVALAVGIVGLAGFLWREVGENMSRGSDIPAEEFLFAELAVPRIVTPEGATELDQTEFMARLGDTQRELVRRLRGEPGVRGVAVGSSVIGMRAGAAIELDQGPGGGNRRWALTANVDADFMAALGQPILMGRGFALSDAGEDGSAVIVNSSFVEQVLGGGYPIGRRLRYVPQPELEPGPWYEIVGVVDDIGMNGSQPGADRGFYRAAAPGEIHPVQLAIRLTGDPVSFTPRLREIASEVDPAAMIRDTRRLDQVVRRNRMVWISSLGGLGFVLLVLVVLSAAGIYALMSFTVTERTKEIGIRVALGAGSGTIARTVASRAVAQLVLGVFLGMPFAAMAFNQSGDIFQMSLSGVLPSALIMGGSVMLVIALLACTGPTLRALRIAPDEALRQE